MNSEDENKNSLGSSIFAILPLQYRLITIGVIVLISLLLIIVIIMLAKNEGRSNTLNTSPDVIYANRLCSITIPLKSYSVSSLYGYRQSQSDYGTSFHSGVDLAAEYGSNVYSAVGGTVKSVYSSNKGGYGRYIVIESEDGVVQTKYAHLSEVLVSVGDKVTTESIIGKVGGSGLGSDHAYGAHLHFEYRENGKLVSSNNLFGYTDIDKCIKRGLYLGKSLEKIRAECNIGSDRVMTDAEMTAYTADCYGKNLELIDVTDCPTNEMGIRLIDCPIVSDYNDDEQFPGDYELINGRKVSKDYITMEEYIKIAAYSYFGRKTILANIEALKFFMVAAKSRLWNQALAGESYIELKENEIWVPVSNCYNEFEYNSYNEDILEEEKLYLNSAYDAISDILMYNKQNKPNNSMYGVSLREVLVDMSQSGYPYQIMIANDLVSNSKSADLLTGEEKNFYSDAKFVKCHWENQATQ